MRAYLLGFMLLLSAAVSPAWAQQTGFNYSGRVKLNRVPFTGAGLFKFAIVSQDGQVTYWTNDGVTVTNAEPTTQVPIDVKDGYFSLKIGDTELPGMAMLDASMFNGNERLYLRVWFNDGEHGFQELTPPSEISNPELLGLQNLNATDIYVNAGTGNDRNSGTKPNRAKQTLQAAWNIVPKFVQQDVRIQLAPGTYYGTTLLKGKIVTGDATISIIGNTSAPATVVLSGANNSATSTTGVAEAVVKVDEQRKLKIKGLQFQYAKVIALKLENQSQAELEHCRFTQNPVAIFCQSSRLNLAKSTISDSRPYAWHGGLFATFHSEVQLSDCEIHDLLHPGDAIACWSLSSVQLSKTLVYNCYTAIHTQYSSHVDLQGGGNVFRNCYNGLTVRMNSTVLGATPIYGFVQYQNCTYNILSDTGAQLDQ